MDELKHSKFQITSIAGLAGDATEQKLRVLPEGIPESISNSTFLQKTTPEPTSFSLTCLLPKNSVQDTVSIEALVVGNILGNVLQNLGDLIQMPYGCGEQNLLNFVPNIIIFIYLKNSNQLTQSVQDKIVQYTQEGKFVFPNRKDFNPQNGP